MIVERKILIDDYIRIGGKSVLHSHRNLLINEKIYLSPVYELPIDLLMFNGFNGRFIAEKIQIEKSKGVKIESTNPKHEKASFALAYTAQSYRIAAKDDKKAIEIYKRVLEEYPKTQAALETRHALIDIAVRNSDPSAGKQIDEYMKIYSESPEIVNANKWAEFLTETIGDACIRMQDWKRGKIVLETVIKKYADNDVQYYCDPNDIRSGRSINDH